MAPAALRRAAAGAIRRVAREVAPLIAEWGAGGRARETHPPPLCNLGSIIAEVFSTDYYAWVKIPWMCNIFACISLFYNII